MLRWIVLLGVVLATVSALWSTRLPPCVSTDLPDPPKIASAPIPPVQETVERVFGLWKAPESHFWSDTLRVRPPMVVRDECVPHGPLVAKQEGRTRPIESSTLRSSEWTQFLRRIIVATGVANPLDKSFATSGVVERDLLNAIVVLPPPTPVVLDGGEEINLSQMILDGGDPLSEEQCVYTGGDVSGTI